MPDITIPCDGCGEPVTFKDLVELHRRKGFCDEVCEMRYTRSDLSDECEKSDSRGQWNSVDAARLAVRGPRQDLRGVSFRSAMEANVARFFDFSGIEWEYEPKMFVFPGEIYAPINYRPDFRVIDRRRTYWVEVKGRWTGTDRQKLRRFKKHCPQEFSQLWVICKWSRAGRGRNEERMLKKISPAMRITDWRQIVAIRHLLPNWEGR